MGKLVLFLADGTTLDVPLSAGRITIGRRSANDVCLPYAAVSGEHAAVITVRSDSFLEDLGSTNGTQVNGKRVEKHALEDGDRIDIGRQELVYLFDEDAVAQRAPRLRRRAAERVGSNEVEADAIDHGADVPAVADATAMPDSAVLAGPAIKVLTGPNAGRRVPLIKDETLIGRVGIQVAAVRRAEGGFRLVPVEGAGPPRVNGEPAPPEGVVLQAGDAVEVAGAQLEFSVPTD